MGSLGQGVTQRSPDVRLSAGFHGEQDRRGSRGESVESKEEREQEEGEGGAPVGEPDADGTKLQAGS